MVAQSKEYGQNDPKSFGGYYAKNRPGIWRLQKPEESVIPEIEMPGIP
jgi:hypothetical protein